MSQEAARTQAQNDASQGKGPADTHTWDYNVANAYNAEYQRQQQNQNNK